MSEEDPWKNQKGSKAKRDAVIWWWLSVMMMGLGGMFAFVGGWIIAIPGFILSMYASATLAKEWAYSAAGAFGIWLLLVMGTLALSWGIILAACSHARI